MHVLRVKRGERSYPVNFESISILNIDYAIFFSSTKKGREKLKTFSNRFNIYIDHATIQADHENVLRFIGSRSLSPCRFRCVSPWKFDAYKKRRLRVD